MAWTEGTQLPVKNNLSDFNKELAKIEGFIEEDKAKVLLAKFLKANPTFTCNLLMGIELFPFQHIAIKSMMLSDYFLAIFSRGMSKTWSAAVYVYLEALFNQGVQIGVLASSFRQCLEENEYILSESGMKKIKDLQVGEKIWAKNSLQLVKNKWENKISKGLKITTKKGYSVKGKFEHKILTYNEHEMSFEYKEIKDLKIGDNIPISCQEGHIGVDLLRNFKIKETKRNANKLINIKDCDDFYYFVGQMLGDGNLRQNRFTLTSGDKETISKIKNYLKTILPSSPITVVKKKNSNTYSLSFHSIYMKQLFEYIGYSSNQAATTKIIPHKIFYAKKQYQAAFIRGLMDSDGCTHKGQEVTLNTSSKKMAKQFHLLLLQFGIVSKFQTEKERGRIEICEANCIEKESYKIRITNYYNLKKYNDKIGFCLQRKSSILKNHIESCERTTNELNNNFYFDKVSSICEIDEIKTYDIEVDKEHCYWGNGFINHNSKMLFGKIEDIANDPKGILMGQTLKITKSNDQWEMRVGRSKVTALPLGSGEKLRGFRFHVIVIDEMLLMPEKIYNEVIVPFLGVVQNPAERAQLKKAEDKLIKQGKLKEEDRYKWPSNKLIALSSASYKFEFLYKMYELYEELILDAETAAKKLREKGEPVTDAHRTIMQLSYDCAPPSLYDPNLLEQAKKSMSESQMAREFGAQFTDDSSGYFKASKLKDCCIPLGMAPTIEVEGEKGESYILAFDPSWSENEASDNFAIHIIKIIDRAKRLGCIVHSYALAGTSMTDHINYFAYLFKHFNIVAVIGDYNGGKQFVSALNESKVFKEMDKEIGEIEGLNFDNKKEEEYKKDLQKLRNEYNLSNGKICVLRTPTSNWIRQANEQLQADIEHKRILFASRHELDNVNYNLPIENLKFSTSNMYKDEHELKSKMIDFLEIQSDNIDLTRAECAMITIKTSPQGIQTFDLPDNLKRQKGPNRPRKDLYSALVLGNWFVKIYCEMLDMPEEESYEGFTPFIV